MKKVENVDQEADEKLTWKAQVFWSHRTWESTVVQQVRTRTSTGARRARRARSTGRSASTRWRRTSPGSWSCSNTTRRVSSSAPATSGVPRAAGCASN
ncbi:hypothetical protein ACQSSU_02435 [Micromonospora echinospora]